MAWISLQGCLLGEDEPGMVRDDSVIPTDLRRYLQRYLLTLRGVKVPCGRTHGQWRSAQRRMSFSVGYRRVRLQIAGTQ